MTLSSSPLSPNIEASERLRRALVTSVSLDERTRHVMEGRLDTVQREYSTKSEQNLAEQGQAISVSLQEVTKEPPSDSLKVLASVRGKDSTSLGVSEEVGAFVNELTTILAQTGDVEMLGDVSRAFRESFAQTARKDALKVTVAQAFETLAQHGALDVAEVSSLEEALPGLRVLSEDEGLYEDESEDLAELIAAGRMQIQDGVDTVLTMMEKQLKKNTR